MITFEPTPVGGLVGAGIAARPAAGRFTGDSFFDTNTGATYIWTGAAWAQENVTATASGFALQNATPTILTATVPNDGRRHMILSTGFVVVTSLETGGAIQLAYTQNGAGQTLALDAGAHAAGTFQYTGPVEVFADPNTAASIVQSSALSAGAATTSAQMSII